MSTSTPAPSAQINVANYVVAFIDLLGQRAALHGQGLVSTLSDQLGDDQFVKNLKASVGSIATLQKRASEMMSRTRSYEDKALRDALPEHRRAEWDELHRPTLKSQNWSDGVMFFTPAADELARCPMMGVFQVLGLTGALCLMGLASRKPIRGGVEIAWAVELNPGELSGAALARAYEIESEVADYPRVVVGPELVRYLDLQTQNPGMDTISLINRDLAGVCRSMLTEDVDGHWIVHYLGKEFNQSVTSQSHQELVTRARAFIHSQLVEHRNNKNTKLAFRYVHLDSYFSAYSPPDAKPGIQPDQQRSTA